MAENVLTRRRRQCGMALALFSGLGLAWFLFPGLPVLRAPRADAREKAAGQELFVHTWEPHDPLAHGDGLGPVFNARSCAACHFQGGVGGGGGNDHNVQAFEVHPTKDRPELQGGLIHKFAVANNFLEDHDSLRTFFPIVPGGVRLEGNCQILTRDFDPIHTESINTTALFGAGWIDRLSGKRIVHEYRKRALENIGRELSFESGGVPAGRPRVLPDGRMGKFGWKAQFATLEGFVAAACANEIGLGNPHMEQAKPWVKWRYPRVDPDLDQEQFASLVAFVDTLPRPVETLPENSRARDQAEIGKILFRKVGCAGCHTPDLGGLAGVFSDFLLHRLDDRSKGGSGYRLKETPEVPLPEDFPLPDEWKTPPLWGVADSAPYFHDGRSTTLEAAIKRHHGDAESVQDAYTRLSSVDQAAVIAFLKTLRAPADTVPVPAASPSRVAMAR